MREFPTFVLMDLLKQRGAAVAYYDPFIPTITPSRKYAHWTGAKCVTWSMDSLRQFDLAIIATNHDGVDYQALLDVVPCIVDTRNAPQPVVAPSRTSLESVTLRADFAR